MIKKMYFKSVESIIWQEKKRMEGKSNVSGIDIYLSQSLLSMELKNA